MRPDPAGNLGTTRGLRQVEIIVRLQVHSELGRGSEVPCQTEGSIGRNCPLAANDIRERY
jgi:hypothetical protein